MPENRTPKQMLFGELTRSRPFHGVKMRWRDLAVDDLKAACIDEGTWMEVAHDRAKWHQLSAANQHMPTTTPQHCVATSARNDSYSCTCGRSFKRQGDLTRHSRFCNGKSRQKIQQTAPPPECPCGRTFRRPGDLKRHQRFCSETNLQ